MVKLFKNFTMRTKYSAIAGTAKPIIIFVGIYGAWSFATRALKRNRVRTRSLSIGVLHGGDLALQRLINYHEAQANPTILDGAEKELKSLLVQEYLDFGELRSAVANVEMAGKEAAAVIMLQIEFRKAEKDQKRHEAYEIDMLLVEMLIYKGDFTAAIERECLKYEQTSDARRPLYRAILHILLEHPSEALRCWLGFKAIQKHFRDQPSLEEDELDAVDSNFEEFKKVVKWLKKDIQ